MNPTDLVAGVDEAGRGPLAGPVAVAAVILDPARPIAGLGDSKALSEARREALGSKRVREQEQQNHVDLVHEVSLLLRRGNFEAAKTKLREGVELLRGQEERLRTEPILCVADELQGHEDRLEQTRRTGYCGFDTRTFPQLDAATRGLRDFVLLRGGAGSGMSALALQIGMDIAATNREACFLMVSLDINRWQVLSRIKCRQARMDWDTLVFGSQKVAGQGRDAWFTREECEALDTAERKLTSVGRRVHVLDRQNFPELTVSSLLEQVGELKSRARAQRAFIVVDHLDLWPADPKTVLVQTEEEARRARLASLKTFREANPDDTLMVIDNSLHDAPGIVPETHHGAVSGGPTPDLTLSLYELSQGERASLMRHLMGEEAEAGQDDSDETGIIYEKLVVSAGREAVRHNEVFLGFNFRTFYFEEVPLTIRPA